MPCVTVEISQEPDYARGAGSDGETFKPHVDHRRYRRWICFDRGRWAQRHADSGMDATGRCARRRCAGGDSRARGRTIGVGDSSRSRVQEEGDGSIGEAGFAKDEGRSRREYSVVELQRPKSEPGRNSRQAEIRVTVSHLTAFRILTAGK